jgi:hypothetical protein
MSLVIGGLYVSSGYYTAKKLDLILSSIIKSTATYQLPIISVSKVIAGRAGFIHTDVIVKYGNKPLRLEGGRCSFFLLQNKKSIRVTMGHTFSGEYFGTYANVPFNERWRALQSYWQDWIKRYWWLAITFVLMLLWDPFKRKLFNK